MTGRPQPICAGGWSLPAPAARGWPRRPDPRTLKPCALARRVLPNGEGRDS